MRIERYYYSEHKAMWEAHLEEMRERLRMRWNTEQDPTEEPLELTEEQKEIIEEILDEWMPMPSAVYTVFDPEKYSSFIKLAKISVFLAELIQANLLVYTEEMTGCISFVAEETVYTEEQKQLLSILISAADEIHIAVSVDTGQGSPTDIDGLVRTEFWFDCCASIAEE